MSTPMPTATLAEVTELNPPLAAFLSDGEEVSFMPMSAVDAESVNAVNRETRLYAEVSKGYTPFLDGDVLIAKITPCFENGKIAHAHLTRRYGFGSTEFHIVRPRTDRADARYLVHYLRQDRIRRQGKSRMTGSAGQRRVPEHFLAGLSVPVPPLPEQRYTGHRRDRSISNRPQGQTCNRSHRLPGSDRHRARGTWPVKLRRERYLSGQVCYHCDRIEHAYVVIASDCKERGNPVLGEIASVASFLRNDMSLMDV